VPSYAENWVGALNESRSAALKLADTLEVARIELERLIRRLPPSVRRTRLLAQSRSIMKSWSEGAHGIMLDRLTILSRERAAGYARFLTNVTGETIASSWLSHRSLVRSLNNQMNLRRYLDRMGTRTASRFTRTVMEMSQRGETADAIADRLLRGRIAPILRLPRHQAKTLGYTASVKIQRDTQHKVILANKDKFGAIQHISVLDLRTTEICLSYNGKLFTIPELQPYGHGLPYLGGVPRHFNCRSYERPVTWKELAEGGPELVTMDAIRRDAKRKGWMDKLLDAIDPEGAEQAQKKKPTRRKPAAKRKAAAKKKSAKKMTSASIKEKLRKAEAKDFYSKIRDAARDSWGLRRVNLKNWTPADGLDTDFMKRERWLWENHHKNVLAEVRKAFPGPRAKIPLRIIGKENLDKWQRESVDTVVEIWERLLGPKATQLNGVTVICDEMMHYSNGLQGTGYQFRKSLLAGKTRDASILKDALSSIGLNPGDLADNVIAVNPYFRGEDFFTTLTHEMGHYYEETTRMQNRALSLIKSINYRKLGSSYQTKMYVVDETLEATEMLSEFGSFIAGRPFDDNYNGSDLWRIMDLIMEFREDVPWQIEP
jgi:hypothetical protein